MFKGLHPIFWIGLAIMYVFTFGFMIAEMTVPGFVYQGQGTAAAFYYQSFALVVLNLFLAWLWVYVPEQADKKKEAMEKEGNK